MGLSLFSTAQSSGGGGLFTQAASSLPKPAEAAGNQEVPGKEVGETQEKESSAEEEEECPKAEDAAGDEATGEEDEEVVFRTDCKLWKLVKHASEAQDTPAESWRWMERGSGIVHVNRHRQSGAGRIVMRMRGVGKLLLNTPVFPTTKYEKIGQKSVRFVGVDDGEEKALSAFRVSLQSSDQQEKFLEVLQDLVKAASAGK